MTNKIIEVSGLEKSFGDVKAVKGIDFFVEQGTLFAFLGPNGAGKSTTIDIISTLTIPDAGRVMIDRKTVGKQDNEIRHEIGIVFQDSLLDDMLTVKENLDVRGSFYIKDSKWRRQAIEEALIAVNAEDFMDRRYGELSGGQRRRADIARALVNTPKILFLDEPTTGLDPQTRKSVWETVGALRQNHGMTIFLTTHYMEEAAQADYITIIDKGEIKAKGTPLQLKEMYATDIIKIKPSDRQRILAWLNEAGLRYTETIEEVHVPIKNTIDALPIIGACKDSFASFEVIRGSMDDVFLNLTGAEIQD